MGFTEGLAFVVTDKHDDSVRHEIGVGAEFGWQGKANKLSGHEWDFVIDPDQKCGPPGSIVLTEKEYKEGTNLFTKGFGKINKTFKVMESAVKGSECSIALNFHNEPKEGW